MFTECQQNRSHVASHVRKVLLYSRQPTNDGCYIRDNLHPKFDIMTFQISNYRMTSVFHVCDVGLCNSDSQFQTSVAPLFVNKNIKCGYAFS